MRGKTSYEIDNIDYKANQTLISCPLQSTLQNRTLDDSYSGPNTNVQLAELIVVNCTT